jgi:hypothetical protein
MCYMKHDRRSLMRLDSRMSRPIRIEFEEAVYHIMARGMECRRQLNA